MHPERDRWSSNGACDGGLEQAGGGAAGCAEESETRERAGTVVTMVRRQAGAGEMLHAIRLQRPLPHAYLQHLIAR